MLQVVQPGLAGLMDGSVSTLAPLFAAAFATHSSVQTFLVGLAASVGAGISMGFAEALSDDGTLTGRGHPWARGFVCGAMTALGGLGHTMPYLIPNVKTATSIAVGVVLVELSVISWIRHRFMDTPLVSALLQVMLGRGAGFSGGGFDWEFLEGELSSDGLERRTTGWMGSWGGRMVFRLRERGRGGLNAETGETPVLRYALGISGVSSILILWKRSQN